MEHADANSHPVGLRICIGVLYFFSFHRGRPMAAPTHGYVPVGRTVLATQGYVPGLAGMLVRMYVRTELFRNSYTFFSASIHNLTVIKDPLQNLQTKRENPNNQSRG